MPFVKLDCGIIHSSLWAEDSDTKICWITLLLLADATGFVRAAASAIAREAGISAEAARRALELFSGPDDESRTPDNQGKRIERVEGGYIVLNYEKYRQRDYTNAERQKRFRQKHNTVTHVTSRVTPVTRNAVSRMQKQTAEAYKETPNPLKGEDGFDLFWSEYPNKQAKIAAKRAWLKIKLIEREEVMRGLALWKKSIAWLKDDGQFIPHPATFLNQRRWEDSPKAKSIKPRVVYGTPLPPRNNMPDADFKKVSEIAKREMLRFRESIKKNGGEHDAKGQEESDKANRRKSESDHGKRQTSDYAAARSASN